MVESVDCLALQHSVGLEHVLILGDFNAHLGCCAAGLVDSPVAVNCGGGQAQRWYNVVR